jgi:hypothetical protein
MEQSGERESGMGLRNDVTRRRELFSQVRITGLGQRWRRQSNWCGNASPTYPPSPRRGAPVSPNTDNLTNNAPSHTKLPCINSLSRAGVNRMAPQKWSASKHWGTLTGGVAMVTSPLGRRLGLGNHRSATTGKLINCIQNINEQQTQCCTRNKVRSRRRAGF